MRAVAVGTPWFVDMARRDLEPLRGDGSVTSSYVRFEAFTDEEADADVKRVAALHDALNTDARLVVGQFSGLNAEGHTHGADLDPRSEYGEQLVRYAEMLFDIVETLEEQSDRPTTLLLTSDHGMRSRGGTCGVSSSERDVPLLGYRPNLAETSESGCDAGLSTLDVPTTVAGLLHMPVPRHAQGGIVRALADAPPADAGSGGDAIDDDAMRWVVDTWQWRDLYYQRRAMVRAYLSHAEVNSEDLIEAPPPDDDMNSVDHAALVGEVDETYADARATAARNHALRNQLLACFLLLCLLLLALAAMQASTYCDPLVLVDCRHVRRSREVRALGWAFIIVCVYYAIALGGFGIYLAISGESWDASLVAMPSQTSTYLALVLCPGILGVYVAYRCEIRARYQRGRSCAR